MKVENLSVGMIVKNYPELCSLLEVEPKKNGNSRNSHIKEIERYINYEKQGHKFIVKELYKIPLPPNNNITQYIPLIERLILHFIVVEGDEGKRLYIPKSKIFQLLKMINNKYSKFKYHQMQLSHKTNISKETIIDFYQTSDDLLERNIERALNSLVSQSLIHWNHTFSVVEVNEITIDDVSLSKETIIDNFGDSTELLYGKTAYLKHIHRQASDEETEFILVTQREKLLEYGASTIQEVIRLGKADDFYNSVKRELKYNYDLINYYKSYMIIFNMKHITDKYNSINDFKLDYETEREIFIELNDLISETMYSNSVNRHNQAIQGLGSKRRLNTRKDNNYCMDINSLIDILVKINSSNKSINIE